MILSRIFISLRILLIKKNFCLVNAGSFKIRNSNNPVVKQGSAYNLYNNILKELNRFTELYEDSNAGHGLGGGVNYGFTGSFTQQDLVRYIVVRAVVFFQTIMSFQLSNPTTFPPFGYRSNSYFKDCINNRICSNPNSDYTCLEKRALYFKCFVYRQ